jgi:hypothetical protein
LLIADDARHQSISSHRHINDKKSPSPSVTRPWWCFSKNIDAEQRLLVSLSITVPAILPTVPAIRKEDKAALAVKKITKGACSYLNGTVRSSQAKLFGKKELIRFICSICL